MGGGGCGGCGGGGMWVLKGGGGGRGEGEVGGEGGGVGFVEGGEVGYGGRRRGMGWVVVVGVVVVGGRAVDVGTGSGVDAGGIGDDLAVVDDPAPRSIYALLPLP